MKQECKFLDKVGCYEEYWCMIGIGELGFHKPDIICKNCEHRLEWSNVKNFWITI